MQDTFHKVEVAFLCVKTYVIEADSEAEARKEAESRMYNVNPDQCLQLDPEGFVVARAATEEAAWAADYSVSPVPRWVDPDDEN